MHHAFTKQLKFAAQLARVFCPDNSGTPPGAAEKTHNSYKKILAEMQHGAGDRFIVPHRKLAVGKSTVVSVSLPDMMLAKLEDVAVQTGRTRNELVQMCIDYAPSRLKIPEE